jgi:hypothetical protein
MGFDGNEDHSINLERAATLTANYRKDADTNAFLGGYISRKALMNILEQDVCVGIRIYNAKSDAGDPTFVLVGVDSEGEDLTGGEIAQFVAGCPPICPKSSQLAGTSEE